MLNLNAREDEAEGIRSMGGQQGTIGTRTILTLALVMTAPRALAQAPISIEQLLVKPSRWQIAASLDYRTASQNAWQQSRQVQWSTLLRYGLSPRLEVNARYSRAEFLERLGWDKRYSRAERASAGLNWLVKAESALPAVLLELRADLAVRDMAGQRRLPGGQLTLTTYKSIDPVVVSLSASVSHERDYHWGQEYVDPGSAWRLEPTVNFALNPQVTLLGGLSVSRRHAARISGEAVETVDERVGVLLGLGYAVTQRHTLFVNADLSNQSGAGANLQWFYQF
jgi:hypothetical protein